MVRPNRSKINRVKRKEAREFKRGKPTIAKQKRIEIQKSKLEVGKAPSITRTVNIPRGQVRTVKIRGQTITVGTAISGSTQIVGLPQSIRGSFEEGTERLVSSEIIHLFIYDIETKRLYVQLTAAGNWKGYTYLSVSQVQFEAFRDAPSKGRHFNSDIKKHSFLRGKRI